MNHYHLQVSNKTTDPVRKGPAQALSASQVWPSGCMGTALAPCKARHAGPITFYPKSYMGLDFCMVMYPEANLYDVIHS